MKKEFLLRKEDILKWIKEDKSKAFMCKKLNCRQSTLNSWLKIFEIEYKGKQNWNRGNTYIKKSAMYYIENDIQIHTDLLKKKLIRDNIKEKKCEKCKKTKWNKLDIPLELHHIDGNRFNNKLENLQILCPNCHAQTFNHSGKSSGKHNGLCNIINNGVENKIERKIKEKKKEMKMCSCGKEILKNSKQCYDCYRLSERKVERPSYEQLIKEIQESNYVQVGKKYGVSDNAIRKWIKNYKKMLS